MKPIDLRSRNGVKRGSFGKAGVKESDSTSTQRSSYLEPNGLSYTIPIISTRPILELTSLCRVYGVYRIQIQK
jgi:hypothetical protein